MKTIRWMVVIALAAMIMLSACTGKQAEDEISTHIYYMNPGTKALEQKEYQLETGDKEKVIEAMLTEMKSIAEDVQYNSVFPEGLEIISIKVIEEGVRINFNEYYEQLTKEEEIMLRAAVVESVVQVTDINYVTFFTGNVPITNSKGEPIGTMQGTDFVQNTGSALHSYQKAQIQLYFANAEGDKLVKEEVEVRYNSNMQIEKLIVEYLIRGPRNNNHAPIIPKETKILGISVTEGICYINFDASFLASGYDVNPELTIFGIVNSIVDSTSITRVMIAIGGSSDIPYQALVPIDKPLMRFEELIQKEEEEE